MGFPDTPTPTPRPLAILQVFRKGKAVSGQIPEVTTKFMAHKTLQGRKSEGTAQNGKYARPLRRAESEGRTSWLS